MGIGNKLKPYPALHKIATKAYFLHEEYVLHFPLKLSYVSARFKNQKKTILCYPEKPIYYHTLYQILKFSGFNFTNKPGNADAIVHFEDTTFRKYDKTLNRLRKKNKIINIRCLDISKKTIAKTHTKAFGYTTSIDPQIYKGNYVKKGNINSLHNGQVLESPEKPEEGYVYQKLVNTKVGNELVELRIPIIGNEIPFVYVKHRPLENRFGSMNHKVEIKSPEKVLSKKEHQNILKFCSLLGLDLGELDVLRDSDDKRIYIVDANNTPASPPYQLSIAEFKKALKTMSDAFQKAFLNFFIFFSSTTPVLEYAPCCL